MAVNLLLPIAGAHGRGGHKESPGRLEVFDFATLHAETLLEKAEYKDRVIRSKNRDALNKELQDLTMKRDSAYWTARFEECGVAGGPIYKMDEVFADPQVQYNKMAVPVHIPGVGDVALVNQPFRLSRTLHEIRAATPTCGVPSSSNASTFIPSERAWISPGYTGPAGLPLASVAMTSVPPAGDIR